MRIERLALIVALPGLLATPAPAVPAPAAPVLTAPAPDSGVRLAPHRAVYDLNLVETRGLRGVESARGRIAFDFTGNACEGYGLKFRQVTAVQSGEGEETVSDLRTVSYESGDGTSYRFRNDTSTEGSGRISVDGSAERRAGAALSVKLTAPKRLNISLDADAVFPNVQMRDLIVAARAGKSLVAMKLFDGSDTGNKVLETLAVIGPARTEADLSTLEAPARQPALAKLARWPIVLSYFPPGSGDRSPSYVLSFDLYENGISRALRLDYGDFVLRGDLTRLDFLPQKAGCQR